MRRTVVFLILGILVSSCSLDVETSYLNVTDAIREQELRVILDQRPFPETISAGEIPKSFMFPVPEGGTIWETTYEDHSDIALFVVSVEYLPNDLDRILTEIEAFFADFEDTEKDNLPHVRSWRSIEAGVRVDLTSTEDRLRLVAAHGIWSPPTVD